MTEREDANDQLFSDIRWVCCLGLTDTSNGGCVCTKTEMALRRYAGKSDMRRMTLKERNSLIESADRCAEGAYTQEELKRMDDKALASATLRAWTMYVRSHF